MRTYLKISDSGGKVEMTLVSNFPSPNPILVKKLKTPVLILRYARPILKRM